MNFNIFKKIDGGYKDSKECIERQQNIDAVLVLSKLLEHGSLSGEEVKKKADVKISQLLDKL